MAWKWSHTQEAYDNCHMRVQQMAKATLAAIRAEWVLSEQQDGGWYEVADRFDEQYDDELKIAMAMSTAELAQFVWDRMSSFSTCTSGGHFAYACPYGCGPHLVSFNKPPFGGRIR